MKHPKSSGQRFSARCKIGQKCGNWSQKKSPMGGRLTKGRRHWQKEFDHFFHYWSLFGHFFWRFCHFLITVFQTPFAGLLLRQGDRLFYQVGMFLWRMISPKMGVFWEGASKTIITICDTQKLCSAENAIFNSVFSQTQLCRNKRV